MQEKQTGKKRVAMGMCSKPKSHVHYDRFIVNSSVNKSAFSQELYADKILTYNGMRAIKLSIDL